MGSKVTVYITNYNYGRFISEAIDSVLNQTYDNIELIVIDDGSTDNSRDIIEEYKKRHNFTVILQQNKGLNATNNVALNLSSGKYITRLDADDYFHPSAISELVTKIESDEKIGLVFPDYYYVDTDGKMIAKQIRHNFDTEVKLLDQEAHGACTLIRADYLKNLGGYDESFTCQDGYELWVKFISHYSVSNLNKPLFYYRRHGSNLTGDEKRILSTRAAINKKNVRSRSIDTSALGIIPVKDEHAIAFKEINGKSLLVMKLEALQESENISEVVITSPIAHLKSTLGLPKNLQIQVHFHTRSTSSDSLNDHIKTILEDPEFEQYATACTLATEYPFVSGTTIDDAINAKFVFGSNSLISAIGDTSNLYIHEGKGLKSILNRESKTRLEREAIFKQVGGLSVFDTALFRETGSTLQAPIGHIRVSQSASFKVESKTSLNWASLIDKTHQYK